MATIEELEALAARCERETPSYMLEKAIFMAVFPEYAEPAPNGQEEFCWNARGEGRTPPCYGNSVDAALSIVPSKYAQCWLIGCGRAELRYYGDNHEAEGNTPALALCAAALKAMAALRKAEDASK